MTNAFYAPAPYPPDEEARQRVVHRLLENDLDLSEVDRLVQQAAAVFGVPMAAATVLDGDRQWLASRTGVDAATTSRTAAFCGYTICQPAGFCVPDALDDPRLAGNPFVTGGLAIRFYAGAPLIVDGMPIGALCAISSEPQNEVSADQLEKLRALAEEASARLQAQLAPADAADKNK